MKTLLLASVVRLAGEAFVNEYCGQPMYGGLRIAANAFGARLLAADADGAEAEDYVATGCRPAEA
jgi:hypothetical protein